MESLKDQAHRMIDNLPDNASWDDLLYSAYVHKKINEGLIASEEGRTTPHEEVKQKFLKKYESKVD